MMPELILPGVSIKKNKHIIEKIMIIFIILI